MDPAPIRTAIPLPNLGDIVAGKYEIERIIGRGGMGAVFAARHVLLKERVAIKVLLGAESVEPEAVARFMAEARAAARIQSEHVARVFDVGQLASGLPYMALEYLDGCDLASLQGQKGTVSVREAADYLLEALEGVGQAHALGIIHRDLKPSNLFLAQRNDGSVVLKVLDFGIAKHLDPATLTEQNVQTSSGVILGSPHYMSPEQLRLAKSVDARSDIWSLGVVLYKLLTGAVPFEGGSLGEVFANILEGAIAPVSAHRPELPVEVGRIVTRCLARDPSQRFPGVLALAEALAPFASPDQRVLVNRMRRFAMPAPSALPVSAAPPVVSIVDPNAATVESWSATGAKPRPSWRVLSVVLVVMGAIATTAALVLYLRPLPHSPIVATASVAAPVSVEVPLPSASANATPVTSAAPPSAPAPAVSTAVSAASRSAPAPVSRRPSSGKAPATPSTKGSTASPPADPYAQP